MTQAERQTHTGNLLLAMWKDRTTNDTDGTVVNFK